MKKFYFLAVFAAFSILSVMAQSVTVTSNRYVATGTQNLTVEYKGAPVGTNAWLGVYKSGAKSLKGSYAWAYTTDSVGTATFDLKNFDAYYVVLFKDGEWNEIARSQAVLACDYYNTQAYSFTLTTDKETYKEGEPVVINWTNAIGYSKDWIGIFKEVTTPGVNGGSTSYAYVEAADGQMTLNQEGCKNFTTAIEPGRYYVTYLLWDGYTEIYPRTYFTVEANATGIKTATTDAANAPIYNLAGQRINKLQKGINIVNGKKILK